MTLTKAEQDFIFWQLLLDSVLRNPIKRRAAASRPLRRRYDVDEEDFK